jgi:hypothetical protein
VLEEVASMAAEALAGHIELMIDEGIPIPEPTDLDTVMADPENRSGVPVMVPAIVRKLPKVVRVNITMPADVLEHIDRYADRHGYNRSGFLVQAAKKVMQSDAARRARAPGTATRDRACLRGPDRGRSAGAL